MVQTSSRRQVKSYTSCSVTWTWTALLKVSQNAILTRAVVSRSVNLSTFIYSQKHRTTHAPRIWGIARLCTVRLVRWTKGSLICRLVAHGTANAKQLKHSGILGVAKDSNKHKQTRTISKIHGTVRCCTSRHLSMLPAEVPRRQPATQLWSVLVK